MVQTLGVVAVLAYDLAQHGARHTFSEPLYLVLLVSLTIYVALTIPVARENGEACPDSAKENLETPRRDSSR